MDQIFSHVSDQIALSGAGGISLTTSTTAVIPSPRPALLTYLRKQFEQQPLFTVTTTGEDSIITAHPNLRRRALGFSPIEHPPLPQPAWTLLEAIGAAGPAGILQSKMGPIVALQPNMVHHYIGLLSARRLIGRRKTIIQRANQDVVVSTTYTSVIVLARYAAQMSYAAQMLDPDSSPAAHDVASDVRLKRVLDVLRQPPHIRAERDLKFLAVPDSDKPPDLSKEMFQRRRHRNYRSLRTKLMKLGAVELVKRKCVTPNGRVLGQHPCLKLLESAKNRFDATEKEEKRVSHPLLANGGDKFVAEVDIVEQIYRMLVDAGPTGISVPELHEYLDSKNVTSAPAKRIRTIITAISKIHPTVERQYFEGSAMYLRISLQNERTANDKEGTEKRRKVGMTTLGENRQEIVMQLLQERQVLVLETLGREVARVEEGSVQKVDPKVMKRLMSDLVAQKRVKLITTARPTIKDNPRSQTLVLVALPDVDERGEVVKNVVTSIVNRSLYGTQDEGTQQDGKTPDKIRRRVSFDEVEKSVDVPKTGAKASGKRRKQNESEVEEEPVIMYQADESEDEADKANRSAEEKDLDAKDSDRNKNGANPKKRKRTTLPNDKQPYEPSERSTMENTSSTEHQQEKASSDEKLASNSPKETENAQNPRKRKTPGIVENPPKRRITKTKPVKPRKKKNAENKKEKGDSERNVSSKKRKDQASGAAVLMKSFTRDLELSRIGRLRATDYGCLKGKLARVRRFHKNLYHIMKARNGDPMNAAVSTHHIAVSTARDTPALGRFSFLSMLKDMTVREYAATVGIYVDHGDAIKKIEGQRIESVLDEMGDDITSTTASRQIQQFVQTMTKLELIQSDTDSQWLLAGAGIIRDFGRGLPSGVVPHGILFSSFNAVEEYWLELEQFSRCKLSRKPITVDLRNEENARRVEIHPIGDLYFPKRWEMGVHRLQKGDQLSYEIILQRMSGIEVVFEENARLRPDNFVKNKLKRFSVEELSKVMDDVLKDLNKKDGMSLPTKRGLCTEQLLLYSRYRSSNPLPQWFLKNIETSAPSSSEKPEGDKKPSLHNSCLLQLTRTPSSIKGLQVRAAMPSVFDTNQNRYFKARVKPKPAKKVIPEGRVDIRRMIPLVTAILRGRAIAYVTNDVEGLDWKIIPSLARYELQLSAADLREASDQENLRRGIVGLCEIRTVRASLDILSLKLVLKMHEMVTKNTAEEQIEPWSAERLRIAAVDLINDWDILEKVCSAVIMEVRDDVRHHTKVFIYMDVTSAELQDVNSRRSILRTEFRMADFMHSRPGSFSHEIELMAGRFRKVADIRLFREVRHAVLISKPYGETTEDEGPQKAEKIQGENNARNGVSDTAGSEKEHVKMTQPLSANQMDDDAVKKQERSQQLQGEVSNLSSVANRAAVPGDKLGQTDSIQDKGNEPTVTPTNDVVNAVQPVRSIQRAPTSLFPRAQRSLLCGHAQGSIPRYPLEIVELAVCAVVRQPPHAQWKGDCLKLLRQFREEDLAKARDRLILRGSISVHTARDSEFSCLQACKNSQTTGFKSVLGSIRGGGSKWGEELRERGDGCVENTKLWNDVCGFEGTSPLAMAFVTAGTFLENGGIELIPEFEEDDEAATHDEKDDEEEEALGEDSVARIKLFFQVEQDKRSRLEDGSVRGLGATVPREINEELCKQYRERVINEIGAMGREGISLDGLLRLLNPHFEEERHGLSRVIEGLLKDGSIRRYAVETNEREFGMTSGIMYIDKRYAIDINGWIGPDGVVKEASLRNVRDEIIQVVLRGAGSRLVQVINSVCARHTSIPRRGIADVIFSLCGEALRSETVVWRDGWRIVSQESRFVDDFGILLWGKRCSQALTANISQFHRIENWKWRNRFSELL